MKTIPLTQGQCAFVDDDDYGFLIETPWCAIKRRNGGFYAVRQAPCIGVRKQKIVPMQAAIMGVRTGFTVDHINGDGLDNRRSNLRFADKSQQQFNRAGKHSGLKGVSPSRGLWEARIRAYGKIRWLGRFPDQQSAAEAYAAAARQMHGEFARIN